MSLFLKKSQKFDPSTLFPSFAKAPFGRKVGLHQHPLDVDALRVQISSLTMKNSVDIKSALFFIVRDVVRR